MHELNQARHRWSTVFVLFATLCAFVPGARAQGIAYTAPQGYNAFPFTNTSCTGAQQTALLSNNNQTEHYLTVTTAGVTAFRATVQGSHDGVTWNDISDLATQSGSTVMGQGYYPIFRVQMTCAAAAGTFTLQYSGEATAPAPQIGAMQSAQVDKTLAVAVTAGSNFTAQTIRSPFANSGGAIYFLYSATGPSGSVLSVSCTTLAVATGTTIASFPLSTVATTQFFTVPLLPCDFVTVTYTAGGASAATFTASILFNPITITGGDPCQGSTAAKKSVAINQAAAGTQQLVALLAGHSIFVCGYNFTLIAGAAVTAQLEYGTGSSCGTGTVALSGAWVGSQSLAITPTHIIAGGGYAVATTASGNALCIVVTGATTPNAQGILTYVQQ